MNKEFVTDIIIEFSEAGYSREDIRNFLLENYAEFLTIDPDSSEEEIDIVEGTINLVREKLFTEDTKRGTISPSEITEDKSVRLKDYLKNKATKKPIANASGKGAPKQPLAPKPKKQKSANHDDIEEKNRNGDMIKGKFPWGKVSGQLAKSAVSKLKEIDKTADRLRAMDLIWESEENFGRLLNRSLDYTEKPEKSKITLAPVPSLEKDRS